MKFKLNGYALINNEEVYFDDLEVELIEDADEENLHLDDTPESDSSNNLLSFDEVMDFDDFDEDCDCDLCNGLYDNDDDMWLDEMNPDTVLEVAGMQFTIRELEENPDLFDEIQEKVIDMHADMIADAEDIDEIKEILEILISYFTE